MQVYIKKQLDKVIPAMREKSGNVLQEILTYKSDDVVGRVKVYESIVKGTPLPNPGIPEAFRVLIKEFQALGLDISVINNNDEVIGFKELESYDDDEEDTPLIEEVSKEKTTVDTEKSEDYDESDDDFEDIEEDYEEETEFDDDYEELEEIEEDEDEIGGEF